MLQFDKTGSGDAAAGDLSHRYLWGPAVDQLLADEQVHSLTNAASNETLWALADRQGSITDMVDNNGTERLHRVFDSFGNIIAETHYDTNEIEVTSPADSRYLDEAFAYTGRLFDKDTGLQNNLKRWYDPKIGRFISEDPSGFAGADANLYRYAGNSPTNFTDPLGEAHFARRPLHGLPWSGFLSHNPFDDFMNTELCHEQLIFDDGQQPGNLGFFEDGQVKPDPTPIGYRPEPARYDDGLMRQAVRNVSPGPYSTPWNNCQDWADKIRREYERLKNPKPKPIIPGGPFVSPGLG